MVLLAPLSLFLFHKNLVLPILSLYSLFSTILTTSSRHVRLLIFTFAYAFFFFLSPVVLAENLNIFFSSLFLVVSSSFFVYGRNPPGALKARRTFVIALYLLALFSLAFRLLWPDLFIVSLDTNGAEELIIQQRTGGWSRDGMFGANVVSMMVLLLNIATFTSSRLSLLSFILTTIVIALIYASRLFPVLSLLYLCYYFQHPSRSLLKVHFIPLLTFALTFSFLLFSITSGLESLEYQRCTIDNCIGRLDKIQGYISSLDTSSLYQLMLGRSASSLNDFSNRLPYITLSDNSFLESILSMGLLFTVLFIILPIACNIYASTKGRYVPGVIFLDLAFVIFMSLYTVIRMTPVVIVYSQVRLYLISTSSSSKNITL